MKRNERITSSWGFLAQGTKAALCLLVLMLSVQAVFAQKFEYCDIQYSLSDGKATATGFGKMLNLLHLSFPIMSIITMSRILSRQLLVVLLGQVRSIAEL